MNASGPATAPHRLGKKPARPGAILFQLASYVDLSLPEIPDTFRHPDPPQFFDFDNSKYGDCTVAGAANESRLWHHEAGEEVTFLTKDVLAAYTEITGFDPAKPSTDQGADMKDVANYRRRKGILDATGVRRQIDAFCAVPLADVRLLKTAIYLLGGVGLGFRFPSGAMKQFERGEAWDTKWSSHLFGDDIMGGHYVPAIGYRGNTIYCVSWGKVQEMTTRFYLRYADEVLAFLDLDRLDKVKRRSPSGFDEAQLRRDLARIARGPVYTTRYRSGSGWAG